MPRISGKNQVTLPVAVLLEAGMKAGDPVVIEPVGEGEVRVRRTAAATLESAFGALTGHYPPGCLDRLDAEDRDR